MTPLRRFIWDHVPHSVISIGKLLFQEKSFLYDQSYLRTIFTNKPTNRQKEPLPWLTYSAITFLDERLKSDLSLFEFGSGFSTLYFEKRIASVMSLEYDKKWFDLVRNKVDEQKTEVIYCASDHDGDYCRMAKNSGRRFDIVLVDGRDRVNCCRHSIDCLSDHGVLIFDDAERDKYSEVYEVMKERGFRHLKFSGLRPASCYFDTSTIFYRTGSNVFDI